WQQNVRGPLRLRLAGTRRKGFAATPDRGAKRSIGKTAPRSKSEPRCGDKKIRHRPQPALRGGRRSRVSSGLSAWLRRDRVKAARLDLSPGPLTALAQGQKSARASCEARGGGGFGGEVIYPTLLIQTVIQFTALQC